MSSPVLQWPVDVGADHGGTVVSQAAAMGWPLLSEEVDEVFDDIPSGEAGTLDEESAAFFCELITSTGVKCTSGTSRPGPTPLVLPRSPLVLEVHREQLRCSLGIPNPASAKSALPRKFLTPCAGCTSFGSALSCSKGKWFLSLLRAFGYLARDAVEVLLQGTSPLKRAGGVSGVQGGLGQSFGSGGRSFRDAGKGSYRTSDRSSGQVLF
ncbi:hypothetical protein E2C01_046961 [Portunus trituberculatus]|uniref:Uncharacterized protein n=1 Tax=Portunus trituberculatus TaxID=210409 RepID=A0A5B7G6A9_PORTR|nr:hypothetical protein [Portunus trituberculatus]